MGDSAGRWSSACTASPTLPIRFAIRSPACCRGISLRRAVSCADTRPPSPHRRPVATILAALRKTHSRYSAARLKTNRLRPRLGRSRRYRAAAASPDRVTRVLITVAVGTARFFEALATNYAQQRRSWYMFFFQTENAEAAVSFNDFAFLEKYWADWSPGWKWAPEDIEALQPMLFAPRARWKRPSATIRHARTRRRHAG